MDTTIELKAGRVALRKPKAGLRNKALMAAEDGNGVKQTTFMVNLIPYCVIEHPWGTRPIKEALDDLEVEEYDKLIEAVTSMFEPGDAVKNSDGPSGADDSQKAPESETSP